MKNVTLTVNGVKRKVAAGPDLVLLDLLREELGLTGTKQSCDRKGQCGACTVIVDGKAVRSCLKKVADLEARTSSPWKGWARRKIRTSSRKPSCLPALSSAATARRA